MTVKVLSKQSFYDISIQYFGTADYAFAIAFANQKSISSELVANDELLLPDLEKDVKVLQYYKARRIMPATHINTLLNINYEFPLGEFPISF